MDTSLAQRRWHQEESSAEAFQEYPWNVTPRLWLFPIAINPPRRNICGKHALRGKEHSIHALEPFSAKREVYHETF